MLVDAMLRPLSSSRAMSESSRVTTLLAAWRKGDPDAFDRLVPLVYDQLREIAARQLRGERPGHTLQPTALVHEAYQRLVGTEIEWQDRVHFFSVAARTMRRVLVDYARSRGAAKRGAGAVFVTLEPAIAKAPETPSEILALDEALDRLAVLDARKADVVQLHYFGGLTHQQIAAALSISETTVDRDLRMARAWLHNELGPEP